MPPKNKQLRCAYVEGDKRCKRPGSGNPPLCEAHRIVLESDVNREVRPGERLVGLLGRVLRGQRVSDEHLYAGIEDAMDMFQRSPSFEELQAQARERLREQARRFQQQHGQAPPRPRKPPGPDPRVVLGFKPGQKVTADDIKKRHRELARTHHPDRGGSVAKMQEINAAVDQLLASM